MGECAVSLTELVVVEVIAEGLDNGGEAPCIPQPLGHLVLDKVELCPQTSFIQIIDLICDHLALVII